MKTLAAAALTATLVAVPTSASADTPNCVSHLEVSRVAIGDDKKFVHRRFDIKGRLVRLPTEDIMVRQYRMCDGNRLHAAYYGGHGDHWHLTRLWIKPFEL